MRNTAPALFMFYSPNLVEGVFSEVRAEDVRLASCRTQTSLKSLKRGGHLL